MYMTTAVSADTLCYVIQCYHYTPEGLSSAGGLYYFCILPKLLLLLGKDQKGIGSVNGNEICTEGTFWNILYEMPALQLVLLCFFLFDFC